MDFRNSVRKTASALWRFCCNSQHSTGCVRGRSQKPKELGCCTITSEVIHAAPALADSSHLSLWLPAGKASRQPRARQVRPAPLVRPALLVRLAPLVRPVPPRSLGPTSTTNGPAIKVIARPCDQPACDASCEENEQILNAYALNPGGAISFIDQRNATFRPQKRPSVFALICVGK